MMKITVQYGVEPTRLGRLRAFEANHSLMLEKLDQLEALAEKTSGSMNDRRECCTGVLATIGVFANHCGLPAFATERMSEMFVALGELQAGRSSPLLKPGSAHSSTFAAIDLAQQGLAHACVELLRDAGLGAGEARTRVARYFQLKRLPRFSEAKLRALGSRLTGAGATTDEAYDFYALARQEITGFLAATLQQYPLSPELATEVVKKLVAQARLRDPR